MIKPKYLPDLRQVLSAFLLCVCCLFSSSLYASEIVYDDDEEYNAAYYDPALKELNDFSQLKALAREQNLPIMLLFTAEWCEYCQVLMELVMVPMARSGFYEGRYMFMRKVSLDDATKYSGFGQQSMTKAEWAYQLNADLTPTILFLNANGQEVASRMVGIMTVELFAAVVHQNLNSAYKKMGRELKLPSTPEKLEALLKKDAKPK